MGGWPIGAVGGAGGLAGAPYWPAWPNGEPGMPPYVAPPGPGVLENEAGPADPEEAAGGTGTEADAEKRGGTWLVWSPSVGGSAGA
jgi:hypothetical protein